MNNNIIQNTESKQLDEQSTKLFNKITDKKKKNPKFVSYIAPLTTKKNVERSATCGDFAQFLGDSTLEHLKLHRASFCGNRFCPMCSWRVACKDSLEISILMEHLRKEENKEFIFLTLTTPNVKGADLDSSIKNYNQSFQRLMQRSEVKNIAKGYIRKLEVTYQKDKLITKELWNIKKDYYQKRGLEIGDLEPNYDTYNPHFHVVLAVNKSYFKKQDQYINHDRWLSLWQEATGDFSITQVDVRKAKANDYKEVYELAKYSAKDSDYLFNREVFTTFYNALKGKQILVFSGLFKDAHKMFKKGELNAYKQVDEIKYVYMVNYEWLKNKYINSHVRELTEEELAQFNKNLIEDIDIE